MPYRKGGKRAMNQSYNTASPTNFKFYWDPVCEYYILTKDELEKLGESSPRKWERMFLISFSFFIPCFFSILTLISATHYPTWVLFLFSLFGIISFLFSILFGILWKKTYKSFSLIMKSFQDKRIWTQTTGSSSSQSETLLQIVPQVPSDTS